jgi:predicted nicotinamide N-methyase
VTYSFPAIAEDAFVTLLELRSVISASGTTGLRTWEASMHLANYLASPDGSELVHDKRVLELGAGSGLVSILCAKYLQPQSIEASDGSQEIVDALEDNIFLNKLQENHIPKAKLLRWGTAFEPGEDGETAVFDVVLGADLVSI